MGINDINIDWLLNAYNNENKTITEIAKILNCGINTVRRKLIKLNIPIRKRYDLCKNNLPHYHGEENPAWKGGRFQRSDGYICVWNGDDYELEHRKVMENYLGRKLNHDEQVHHKNEIKNDNSISNLEVLSISKHAKKHHKGKDLSKYIECICKTCGNKFMRRIKEVERHPNTYCCRECYKIGINI